MIAKAKARAGSVRQSLGLTTHRAHEPTDARAGGAVISVPDLGMALNDDLGTPKPPLAIGNSGDTVNVSLHEDPENVRRVQEGEMRVMAGSGAVLEHLANGTAAEGLTAAGGLREAAARAHGDNKLHTYLLPGALHSSAACEAARR